MVFPEVWMRMHIHLGHSVKNIANITELGLVELDILPGCKVTIALVPTVCDQRQLAHRCRIQAAIWDCHAQHIGMQLQIEPVH